MTVTSWLGQLSAAHLSTWIGIATAVLFCGFGFFISSKRRMGGKKLPPGPKGWPIFGNAFDLLEGKGFYVPVLRQWAKAYGPIVLFRIGAQKHVIISDDKVAQELFSKRGTKYADRYVTHAIGWTTMNQNPALRPRDDGWRRERSFIHNAVSITANDQYNPIIDFEGDLTTQHLLRLPNSSKEQIMRFAYAVLTRTLMGFTVNSSSDQYILENESFRNRFMAGFQLDKFPSNVLGFLRRLPKPLIPNSSALETLRKDHLEQVLAVRKRIEDSIATGTAEESSYTKFLRNRDEYKITDLEISFTYQAMINAGAHNPQQALLTALSLLVEYSDWQARLQEEIDGVVGAERTPNWKDIPKLPLLRAVVKEAIRIRGLFREAGLPRRVVDDDSYGKYFFEKGTIFHMNFSTILADEQLYPDGKTFNPDRYLDPSYPTYREPLTLYPNCRSFAAFGYGRRGCPGAEFAERTCVTMLAKLAWGFKMLRPVDKHGKEIEGLDVMDWKFRLVPRDSKRVEVVEALVREATTATD